MKGSHFMSRQGHPVARLKITGLSTSNFTMAMRNWALGKIILGCATVFLGAYYCRALNLGPLELLRFVMGAVALWLPLGGWLYLLLRNEVPDRIIRLVLSAGGSYALTTLFYFGAATLRMNWLFYSVEAVAGVGLIYYAIKNRRDFESLLKRVRRFDWVLAVLVAASMVANVSVQSVWRIDAKTGAMIYDGYQDQLYHVGQAYELSRHVPPRQAMIRGGFPERAYHNFMHLTTMLVDRYTSQPDMLRAHLVYHYAVIQILMCLLLYGIGKTLAASRVSGYCALALMYVVVVPFDFSHVALGLDAMTLGSPQMYAGLVVLYVGLLGLLIVLEHVYRGEQAPIAIFLTALVLGATTRFRIHIALAVLPAFLLVTLYLWRKRHQNILLLAGLSAAVVAGLLYLEMRSTTYLHGTTNFRFGYSGLSSTPGVGSHLTFWPFAESVREWLWRLLPQPDVFKWVWEVTCLFMFSLVSVIGIPLLAAIVIYTRSERSRRIFASFNFLIFWAVVTSICFSIIFAPTYDAGAMQYLFPFHTRWYLFPFEGVALWLVARAVQKRLCWPAAVWSGLASITLAGGLFCRVYGPASPLTGDDRKAAAMIRAEEWPAFLYLREHTSPDSIVLTNRSWGPLHHFVISGLTGRAAYQEIMNPKDEQSWLDGIARYDRANVREAVWSAVSEEQFCQLLRSTPITHVLEFGDQPLLVHPPNCLARVWENPEHTVTIWQVTQSGRSIWP
jgi:hypothetical protein